MTPAAASPHRVPAARRRAWAIAVVVVILTALQGAATATAATAPGEPVATSTADQVELTATDVDAWLDGILPAILEREAIPGAAVSVVHDGAVVTERGYGLADTGSGDGPARPVEPGQTLFRVGSISKLLVATAVMQLVESEELDLDRPVTEYLDFDLPTRFATPVTLRHLLTHTAGFEDAYAGIILEPGSPVPPLREWVTTAPPEQIFEPGTTPAYSNYSSALVAYVVERVSGRDFAEYVQAEVLDRAGMTTASFAQPLPSGAVIAHPYPDAHADLVPFELVGPWPVGSLSATAADVSAFMLAHLDKAGSGVLEAATLRAMQASALGEDELGNLAAGPRMTLGYFEEVAGGRRVLGHGGDVTHSHAHLRIYPDEGAGVFVALNGSGARPDSSLIVRQAVLQGFADRYFPATDPPPAALATSAEHAAIAAGSYTASRRGESTFVRANALLTAIDVVADGAAITIPLVTDTSGEPVRMVEVEPWVWQQEDGPARVAMRLDDSGQVEAISVGPALVLQPVPAWRSAALPALVGSLAVLLVALLAWPARALIGWRLGSPLRLGPLDRRLRRLAMLAVLAILVALGLWYAVQASIIGSGGPGTALTRGAQLATAIGVLGAVPATWRAVRAWASRSWWTATFASITALAFLGFGYAVVVAGLLLPDLSY